MHEGRLRRRIERALNDAYGTGLLSEDTHAGRLDTLLREKVLDPAALLGDLSVRRRRTGLSDTLGRGLRALGASGPVRPVPPLLALDWTGATEELLIGRGLDCDVRLEDVSVSRRHAQLRYRDGGWILRDLESTNGTTVNGTRVVRCRLLPGDIVAFAETRLLVD